MSDLTTSFTFRLTHTDKAALSHLAARAGKDRGAVLRQIIRLSQATNARQGVFIARKRIFPICLQTGAHTE